MYIYVFGSICRGEIDKRSDIDLLAIVEKDESRTIFDKNKFSIYTSKRLIDLWDEGNPFAWHLFLESKLIYSDNNCDLIQDLGKPKTYANLENDLNKFSNLFNDSIKSINESENSRIFDLSMIFLAIRNFATCYSLGSLNEYNFSRHSALRLTKNRLEISPKCYEVLERARILSTRGIGELITKKETQIVLSELDIIKKWFHQISFRLCMNSTTE
ncbi:nucleotidyltransferase domain-containing protein [Aureibaculum algae]|uniref:Nucleotidyltransferase domain-containing protein n=1 Tax=Aureibaculum algae TaxID=2584122 RepID=A0A5B7TUV4_9FLAO|nr:nucleotidyltransferase domain-containing protein [Aureibaculum algae]QCX38657.1 nucleotidyltransferase domain-containing protein [Aureibaculum algae]